MAVIIIKDIKDYVIFQETYLKLQPKCKILRAVQILHDCKTLDEVKELVLKEHINKNHRGIDNVYKELKEKYYFPQLKKLVTEVINMCSVCERAKYDRTPLKIPFEKTFTPNNPREVYHVDVWYFDKNTMYLTCIDKFSKFAAVQKIKSRAWPDIKNAFVEIILSVGKPKLIITDNESAFGTCNLKNFLDSQDNLVHFTTPNNKTSNSDIERFHSTLNEHIRIIKTNPQIERAVSSPVTEALFHYNNTRHSTTKCKPITVHQGNPTSDELNQIRNNILKKNEQTLTVANKNRIDVDINPKLIINIKKKHNWITPINK